MPPPAGPPGEVPCLKIEMACEFFDEVPHFSLPKGYRIRMLRAGEENEWARIEYAAGEFGSVDKARAHFDSEFGPYLLDMQRRCFILTAGDVPVGTATAWRSTEGAREGYGRLHWVGIHPEHQGRGLSKPLVEAAVRKLDDLHGRAYLTSQTTSWKAVKVYLDFGFRPVMEGEHAEEAWRTMAELLHRPDLSP